MGARLTALALAGAMTAVATAAPAQRALPSDRVTPAERAQFSLCRAAVLYHLQGPPPPQALVSREAAQAMIEQISFVMFETVKNAPSGTLTESRRSLAFIEQFFLDFRRTLNEEQERLADLQTREEILMACVPFLWRIVADDIDYLIQWREQTIAAPADGSPTP